MANAVFEVMLQYREEGYHAYQQDYFQAFFFFFFSLFLLRHEKCKNILVLLCKRAKPTSIACFPKLLFPIRCQVVPHLFSKKAMNHYNLACHLSLKICKVSPTLQHIIIAFATTYLLH